ncbi:LytTR family DNA-binding domain-containing protein [Aestuariibacter halophilus]|uniref:LytTR family DNA-binding domain-containing protein n=1 Tax=Fluctibacter halophilus TaxID=226011 RepID=A0ABS8GBC6_9ALTE|nr:LytTR family DNA-binding domain-containing protein [Aestuariibacter halophilus]MCC2617887.1 LytTR family DNA-binding domain-containing protein [Aestuariibacter halophilus]
MLKVLIADDEGLARDTVKLLLEEQSDIGMVLEAEDGLQARDMVIQHQPDIVILDIEMPGLSGIDVAREIPSSSIVIFATAYNEHAVAAFELNAIDYLLKPFEDERFFRALERARTKYRENHQQDYAKISNALQGLLAEQHQPFKTRLVIREPGRIRLVDVDQIEFITGAGNYAEIHLLDGKQVLQRETLTTLETQLDPEVFVRIHRSSIVRRSAVTELRPNDKGDYSVILRSGEVLTLSRRNRSKLEELTH